MLTHILDTEKIPLYVQAFNKLYVGNQRYKYLIQHTSGNYETVIVKPGSKKRPLVDTMLVEHLKGRNTYGVFADFYGNTPFMVIDFDFKDSRDMCKWYFYRVKQAVIECGIPPQYIYASDSGNKGLHLELFFSEPISFKTAENFFYYVLHVADCTDLADKAPTDKKDGTIEFRPTDKSGVKLPLGIHHVTGRRCLFVNPDNVDDPLPLDTLLTVKQLDVELFNTVMQELADTYGNVEQYKPKPSKRKKVVQAPLPNTEASEEAQRIIEQADEELFSKTKMLAIYGLGEDEDYTVEYYNRLLTEGIKMPGTRHKITYQLALYLKTCYGADKEYTQQTLLEWLKRQPTHVYTTPLDKAIADTIKIVEDIYQKNRILSLGKREITATTNELRTILTAKSVSGKHFTPKQKRVLFALFVHAKKFATANGTFFMAYSQITEATGMANRSRLKALIQEFEAAGLVKIHRCNTKREGTFLKHPNVYEVPFIENKNAVTSPTSNDVIPVADGSADTFDSLIKEHFTATELRKILPRRQVQAFIA